MRERGHTERAAGVTFGKYQVFDELGAGGMGTVVLAAALGPAGLNKLVVLKRLRTALADDPACLSMFLDEARLAARLSHPNIVHTHEIGEHDGTYYIAMEYLEGQPLGRIVKAPDAQRVMTPAMWAHVIAEALQGLHHAHELRDYDGKPLNVIHRDISPQNVFLTYSGEVKLVDFGIAKAEINSVRTSTGVFKGKLAYMAPEQAHGVVDRRVDLFAMGVVLWEMLTGHRLFSGEPVQVIHQILEAPIPRASSLRAGVSPQLDDIVEKALARDPDARFQTAEEMKDALEGYLRSSGDLVRAAAIGGAVAAMFQEVRERTQEQLKGHMANLVEGTPTRPDKPVVRAAAAPPSRTPWRQAQVSLGVAGVVLVLAALIATRRDAPPGPVDAHAVVASPAEPEVLRVRLFCDMTGPTRDVSVPAVKGQHDYLRALDAAGGIRGRRLDVEVVDTRYDQQAALAAFASWKAKPEWPEVSIIFAQGTSAIEAVAPLAAADEKVVISTAYTGEFGAPAPVAHVIEVPTLNDSFAEATVAVRKQSPGFPYVFFAGTDYATAARVAVDFAWLRGAKRVGFFHCTTSAFCHDPVDAAKSFLKRLSGTAVGRSLAIEITDTDEVIARNVLAYFRAELAHKLEDPSYAPVDWVWLGNNRRTTSGLGEALARVKRQLGMSVSVISNMWGVDEELYEECGAPCVGIHVVQPIPPFGDPSASGMAQIVAIHRRYRELDEDPPERYSNLLYVHGYLSVALFRAAVERVLDAGRPVTGANLKAALEAFQMVQLEGLATVSFSPSDHRPQSMARIFSVSSDGRLKAVGQPLSIALQPEWLGW